MESQQPQNSQNPFNLFIERGIEEKSQQAETSPELGACNPVICLRIRSQPECDSRQTQKTKSNNLQSPKVVDVDC
jgi:hypothetical protein